MTAHAGMHTITSNSELATLPGNWPLVLCLEMQRLYSWDGAAYIEFLNEADVAQLIADAIAEVEGGVPVWGTVTGVLSAQLDLDAALDGKEPANANLQAHVGAAHAPSNATANSSDATLLARANHTGTQSADTLTDGTTNKAFLATERTKLSGIATGATVNSSDATLLARANHTGTQAVATITGLGTLATQNGTFSGTSSGTNTGDQNSIAGITGTIAQFNTAVTDADLATTALITTLLSSYRTILDSSGSHIAARVAGTYGLAQSQPLAITGTGTLYPLNSIYILSTDYPTVNALAAKLRIRANLYTNDVSPSGNYTIGLHPITRPATSGGAGLNIYTIGAAVAGSTLVFTAPAADGLHFAAGADFALPADGHYIIGVVTTATVAASAHVHISASLQIRNA